jgi:adenylate cyclase, class 2
LTLSAAVTTESHLEIEIKIPIFDIDLVRQKLSLLQFKKVGDRTFERNLVFDFADRRLKKSGFLLRLRRTGEETILTLKKPARLSRQYKIREERNVTVGEGESMRLVLEALGLKMSFAYEKYREVFKKNETLIMLDQTPIGDFMEIEGAAEAIDETAALLGFQPHDYILDSYYQLFRQHRRRGHMVFPS